MNRNNPFMAAVESLEERLSNFLQRIETATGLISSSRSTAVEEQGSRQLLERLDQLALSAGSTSPASVRDAIASEELRSLSEVLERKLTNMHQTTDELETLVRSWQEQLDRMELRLESLLNVSQEPARFG